LDSLKPRVSVYLVTEDWYFVSHRLPMARAALRAGFEVHVATRVADHAVQIEREGFILHPLDWRRGSLSPLHLAAIVRNVRSLYREIRPAIAHHVALAPSIVGSLAATGLNFPCLNALAGFGFAFTSDQPKARAMRLALMLLLRHLLRRPSTMAIVQNPDDRLALEMIGVSPRKIVLIPGSGVDTDAFQPLPEPPPPITAAFVGRLLYDKGLETLIAAHRLLRERQIPFHLTIAGKDDPANPASVPATVLAEWKRLPGVTFLGHVEDVRTIWSNAHIAVLPSRREGLPLSLLEAAACGRPLIATDVPGCREIARAGENALLVPPDEPLALAATIERIVGDPELRRRFGVSSRQVVEAEFSSKRIGQDITALYRKLLGDQPTIEVVLPQSESSE
jgi:glycosyltransferase involved in cell wall biosynthesis